MKRRIYAGLLALALALAPLGSRAEGLSENVDEPPAEVEEFSLSDPEATPEALPEPTAAQTPLPTLEPGSINYPADKVNFEREIWAILTKRWGLADFQAAGLMSSLYAESSFCPYNVQGKDGVDDRGRYNYRVGDAVGFGLAQWTSAGRKAGLQRYAKACGDPNLVWDFDVQMGYMKKEIDMRALKATETLYEATEWAVVRYERPNQLYENSWPGSRYEIARQIFAARTGRTYEEPELDFSVRTPDGADAAAGFQLAGEGELTVSSNYYWRLAGHPGWLEVQSPKVDDPAAWEACACGYAGQTPLRLRTLLPPVTREFRLTFVVYRGARATVAVPFTYTGKGLAETLLEQALQWFGLAKGIARAG